MYSTLREAHQAVREIQLDMIAIHGETVTNTAHHDLVEYVADFCTSDIAQLLRETELGR